MLMETTLRGCRSLIPIIDFLTQIRAELRYDEERSWLHMIATIPKIRSKLAWMWLDGKNAPKDFDWTLPRTPHRGTPFGTAGFPALANLARLELSDIHFTQFSDLVVLLRHFSSPKAISLRGVTWDKTDVPLYWSLRPVYNKRPTRIKYISVQGGTSNTLAATAAHALSSRLPVQTLPPHERLQVQQLFQTLHPDLHRVQFISPFPSELLGRMLITCSHPEPDTTPQVIAALLIMPHMDSERESHRAVLHSFLGSVINFPRLRAVAVAYYGVPDEGLFSLATVVASISQLRPDIICRVLHRRDHTFPEAKEWVELEWRINEPTGHVWTCDEVEDKEHSHGSDSCQAAVLGRAMSSAVEEHMRKTRFTPYAEIQAAASARG
ncbi:hypothetical protein BDW22DRAFT_624038 [Trametopsis cervina]|nr:hypothetical protein BDW22DRAFT_624038 [Trametopsis cervina]